MRISDWSSDVCSSDLQFGWKRIGSVRDSTAGSTGRIPAYDYFDLNLAVRPPVEGLTLAFGIDNLFDKKPPLPVNPGAYNRSEEHTSELQSLMRTSYAVLCLKKQTKQH